MEGVSDALQGGLGDDLVVGQGGGLAQPMSAGVPDGVDQQVPAGGYGAPQAPLAQHPGNVDQHLPAGGYGDPQAPQVPHALLAQQPGSVVQSAENVLLISL